MKHSFVLGCLLAVSLTGCLVPGNNGPTPNKPTPPTPTPTLSSTLTQANMRADTEYAKLAATIAAEIRATGLTAEQQGEAWNKGSAAIATDTNGTVAKHVKAALSAATTPQDQAAVWEAISKGYRREQ